ncbi:MAG: hypothetical protein ACYCWE_05975 [Eubacteriales bacterium]
MNKFLVTAIVLLLTAVLLGSCAAESLDSTETSEMFAAETEDLYSDRLPAADLGGGTITILAAAEDWINEYYVESTTGDIVEDAVYARNRNVEERFNVKLDYVVKNGYGAGMSDISSALSGSVMGGTGEYDITVINGAYVAGRMLENVFTDLNTMPYLDFSQPWWIENINKQMTVGGKLYVGAGRYSLSSVKRSWALYFSKNLTEAYNLGNLYDEVYGDTWTYDRWMEYAAAVSADLDGDGRMNKNDRYGIVGTDIEPFWSLQISLGRIITFINDQGQPELPGADEFTCEIFEKLQALRYDNTRYFGTASYQVNEGLIAMLANDQSLFSVYTLNITSFAEMREIENYGILPIPKLNESQKSYYTQCFVDFCSIPKVTGAGSEDIAIVLEALNAENYRSVIPQYYEIALTRKFIRDDESAEMLDIICAGAKLDFGAVFFSTISMNNFMIGQLFKTNGSATYMTFWEANRESMTSALNNITETLASFE